MARSILFGLVALAALALLVAAWVLKIAVGMALGAVAVIVVVAVVLFAGYRVSRLGRSRGGPPART